MLIIKVEKMSEQEQIKDKFWWYVGSTVLALVAAILLVKQSENEKFAPIKQQVEEENAQMNIRVLNDSAEK
jgi:formate hydrogenlyase subunit 3/multisubunit Na+/H+ antiporter MnhD subunit